MLLLQIQVSQRGTRSMLFSSLSTPKVLQVQFCYLNTTMTHLSRKLEHISTISQVHLSKCMTEYMRRHLNINQTCFLLDTCHNQLDSTISYTSTRPSKE